LSDLQSVRFTPERNLEKKKAMLNAVLKLGSDDFDEREKAEQELQKMGKAIRTDLAILRERFHDPEITARIEGLLSKIPSDEKLLPSIAFDVFQTKAVYWGDAGDAAVTIQLDGKNLRLTRKEIAGI